MTAIDAPLARLEAAAENRKLLVSNGAGAFKACKWVIAWRKRCTVSGLGLPRSSN